MVLPRPPSRGTEPGPSSAPDPGCSLSPTASGTVRLMGSDLPTTRSPLATRSSRLRSLLRGDERRIPPLRGDGDYFAEDCWIGEVGQWVRGGSSGELEATNSAVGTVI